MAVILALIKTIGIPNFLALKIKLGQISESTKKITSGFHFSKIVQLKNLRLMEKIYGKRLEIPFSSFLAISLELKVVVVIKNFNFAHLNLIHL